MTKATEKSFFNVLYIAFNLLIQMFGLMFAYTIKG